MTFFTFPIKIKVGMKKSYLIKIWSAIFNNKKEVLVKGKNLKRKLIQGLRAFETNAFIFIEQNPRKRSRYAVMAKKGKKIMWVIRKKDSRYKGVVMDGKLRTF